MFIALLAIGIGFAVGSFANVVIDRAPRHASLGGRSRCDRCRRNLRWWELVPVVSALVLRFRCPTCAGAIAFRYTAVEVAGALLALLVLWRFGGALTFVGAWTFLGLVALGVLAVIDADLGVVPDAVSVPAIIVVGLAHLVSARTWMVPAGIAAGAAWFALQRCISRGRWVGDGDTRVGALMGAILPLQTLTIGLAASYVVGGAVAAALLLTHRAHRGDHIPFVPFLFAGTVIAVAFGERILGWYGLQ